VSAPARAWVAGTDEAETVVRLLGEFRDWLGRTEPTDRTLAASVPRLLGAADCEYLLAGTALDDADADGLCQLRYRQGVWYVGPDCWLEDLYVSRRARRVGLGSLLVDAAIERATARGCARIELDTGAGNTPALSLYARFGFTAREPNGEARLFMRRMLSPGGDSG
jgi:GNAT superfamily N-acetyltransferase